MAVLSRPINMSFEIAPNKTAAFLNRDNKNALQRAIARSDKHISKVPVDDFIIERDKEKIKKLNKDLSFIERSDVMC